MYFTTTYEEHGYHFTKDKQNLKTHSLKFNKLDVTDYKINTLCCTYGRIHIQCFSI